MACAACQTWQASAAPPLTLVAEERPSALRVTRTDGAVVVLEQPISRGDSLTSGVGSDTGVALADIRLVEVRRFSVARSLVLAIGIGVVGASWTAVAQGIESGTWTPVPPLPKE